MLVLSYWKQLLNIYTYIHIYLNEMLFYITVNFERYKGKLTIKKMLQMKLDFKNTIFRIKSPIIVHYYIIMTILSWNWIKLLLLTNNRSIKIHNTHLKSGIISLGIIRCIYYIFRYFFINRTSGQINCTSENIHVRPFIIVL